MRTSDKRPAMVGEKDTISDLFAEARVLPLRTGVQHYAWGDPHFIPSLLSLTNPDRTPYAELWLGAHPELPSRVDLGGGEVGLDELISKAGGKILGHDLERRFSGQLPFLLKILAAAKPLSIQAHPTRSGAVEGYERENAAGIPLTALERNYRDPNHKPELVVALTDFYALRGFRPFREISMVLDREPELARWSQEFKPTSESLRSVYESLMGLRQEEVDETLSPLLQRLSDRDRMTPFSKDDRAYWMLRADREFSRSGHHDRGLFALLMLNLVHLRPTEAIYLPSGVLHAHLEGVAVEIMANSNNVLRGGLTSKHVDVPELLRTVIFEGEKPEILHATDVADGSESRYETPAEEFELRRVALAAGESHSSDPVSGPQILFVLEAGDGEEVTIVSGEQRLVLRRGQSVIVPHGLAYTIHAAGPTALVKAGVPSRIPSGAAVAFRGTHPKPLRFGTSGLRGLVEDITDLEAFINTRGFLGFLLERGDVEPGERVCIAGDLRPSTDSETQSIMRAVARAIEDAGLEVENHGTVPTPALTYAALKQGAPSVMVTGSHIPFDRNGIKFNLPTGEVLKEDEAEILCAVDRARVHEYAKAPESSLFEDDGSFRPAVRSTLPPPLDTSAERYRQRYLSFFPPNCLAGQRIVFFQHSAVGRDLLVDLLRELGAEVFPVGRSAEFIPIDTEDITPARLTEFQSLVDEVVASQGPVHALVSTDGDSDRPLLVGLKSTGEVRFFGGDLLGAVVAEYLGADSVSVPVSTSDAVDLHLHRHGIRPMRTRIGSPYVIAAMKAALATGKKKVVGWEANGGFLTGSTIERGGRFLDALPTRDAALPLLAALHAAVERRCSLCDLFAELPPRFSRAGLIDGFPREKSQAILERFGPRNEAIQEVSFEADAVVFTGGDGEPIPGADRETTRFQELRRALASFFTPEDGFGEIRRMNFVDGLRLSFRNGDIAHIRPSGNAPQIRIYAVADMQSRADRIVELGIREPDGILRRL